MIPKQISRPSNASGAEPAHGVKPNSVYKKLVTLRTNLLKIESITMKQKVVSPRAKNETMKQFRMNGEIIDQLQEDLEELKGDTHDAQVAQAAAKAELNQLKVTMAQHTAQVVSFLQDEAMKQKQIYDEKICKIEREMVHLDWLRQKSKCLKENCKKMSANLKKVKVTNTGVISRGLGSKCLKLVYANRALRSQLDALRREKSALEAAEASGNREATSCSKVPEEPNSDLLLGTGRDGVLVTHRKYFGIEWTEQYTLNQDGLHCKMCAYRTIHGQRVKDHVWCRHFGGRFQCPFCNESSKVFLWRHNVRAHIMKQHPDVAALG